MNISVLDGSNYFKGLLLLIRKDNNISESEHELMMRTGKALGFEKNFTETAIQDIIKNKYISETPLIFSKRELAEKFLHDGLIIASTDKKIHPHEEEWLLFIARANKIEDSWYFNKKKSVLHMKYDTIHLEANNLKVLY